MRSVYKFVLIDEWGGALRKFATRREATPYLTDGMTLKALPKQPDAYSYALTLVGEARL
jgi:hypothetical protein